MRNPSSTDHAFQRLKQQLELVSRIVDDLLALAPSDVYQRGAYTALKIIFLTGYIGWIYTTIIPKQRFRGWYYLDPLSGPGLTRISEQPDIIIGSPIVASIFARQPFTRMYLAESQARRRQVLSARLDWVRDRLRIPLDYRPIGRNCNRLIRRFCRETPARGSHYLAFVDAEGMEMDWDSMRMLLQRPGDIIYAFQTDQIQRAWGLASSNSAVAERMDKFYGGDEWREAEHAQDLPEIYLRKIAGFNRPVTRKIMVRKSEDLYYHLLFATRRTRAENPWMAGVDRMKEFVETHTEQSVKLALDVISGRRPVLDDFFRPPDSQTDLFRFG